ncbi:DUF6192 family protein [Amycolatopsis sp. WGS_07]|uniref:DUF6192 family protein n=1 Tax=Amycolatopsis sp. WGS_07 TaxID=3076764 RepID=UPI0038730B6F
MATKKVGHVTSRRYDQLLRQALRAVDSMSSCQFELGDIALEIEPMHTPGGVDEGTYETLTTFANDIGVEFSTLLSYRSTSAAWPREKRQLQLASFTTHRMLNSMPKRFSIIKKPPANPRSGRRYWRTDDAARIAGRTPTHPETTGEKIARVHDLARDDEVATTVATTLLHRPEVASRVMADQTARHLVNSAQVERARQARSDVETRVPAVRQLRYSMEVTQLLGGCAAFTAAVTRALPMLRAHRLTGQEENAIHAQLDKVNAAADWCRTAVNTGDTSMDQQFADLLAED